MSGQPITFNDFLLSNGIIGANDKSILNLEKNAAAYSNITSAKSTINSNLVKVSYLLKQKKESQNSIKSLVKSIFNSFIAKDNLKITSTLKRIISIYRKSIKMKLLSAFLQWRVQVSKISLSKNLQHFDFMIKKENVHERLFRDYKVKELMLSELERLYDSVEAEKHPFTPQINRISFFPREQLSTGPSTSKHIKSSSSLSELSQLKNPSVSKKKNSCSTCSCGCRCCSRNNNKNDLFFNNSSSFYSNKLLSYSCNLTNNNNSSQNRLLGNFKNNSKSSSMKYCNGVPLPSTIHHSDGSFNQLTPTHTRLRSERMKKGMLSHKMFATKSTSNFNNYYGGNQPDFYNNSYLTHHPYINISSGDLPSCNTATTQKKNSGNTTAKNSLKIAGGNNSTNVYTNPDSISLIFSTRGQEKELLNDYNVFSNANSYSGASSGKHINSSKVTHYHPGTNSQKSFSQNIISSNNVMNTIPLPTTGPSVQNNSKSKRSFNAENSSSTTNLEIKKTNYNSQNRSRSKIENDNSRQSAATNVSGVGINHGNSYGVNNNQCSSNPAVTNSGGLRKQRDKPKEFFYNFKTKKAPLGYDSFLPRPEKNISKDSNSEDKKSMILKNTATKTITIDRDNITSSTVNININNLTGDKLKIDKNVISEFFLNSQLPSSRSSDRDGAITLQSMSDSKLNEIANHYITTDESLERYRLNVKAALRKNHPVTGSTSTVRGIYYK